MKKTVVLMLIFCLLFCVSCNKSRTSDEIKGDQATDTLEVGGEPVENQKENIVLYFSDNQGMALSKEEREVSRDDATDAEFVMRELMKGCENPELISILPKDLVLNSCKVQDGICIVDMSEEFLEIQGTAAQEMAMYSVINTLCGVEGVEKVRFLIDGKKVPVFGVFDFESEFEADMSLVK